jgi:hypothetical protein
MGVVIYAFILGAGMVTNNCKGANRHVPGVGKSSLKCFIGQQKPSGKFARRCQRVLTIL